MNCAIDPVDDKVEAIFLAIIPLLPTPVKIILPLLFFKIFIAFTNFLSIFFDKIFSPSISVLITFFAILITVLSFFLKIPIIYVGKYLYLAILINQIQLVLKEIQNKL